MNINYLNLWWVYLIVISLMIKVCPFLAFKFDLVATPNSKQELSLNNRPTRQRISNKRMRSKRTMNKRLTHSKVKRDVQSTIYVTALQSRHSHRSNILYLIHFHASYYEKSRYCEYSWFTREAKNAVCMLSENHL